MMTHLCSRIWKLALPYLGTRDNEVHTAISLAIARELLKPEGGRKEIVIPAIILHDVGWATIPEDLQMTAFGPKATAPDLNRKHEKEGVRIAGKVLQAVGYPKERIVEILEIIDGHDSRAEALSKNDMIVKDSDRLWRFTHTGFTIDIGRFQESYEEGLARLKENMNTWLFTRTAKQMASEKIELRENEWRRRRKSGPG